MNLVDRQLPGETAIHLVLDNLATHKTPRVRNWFARRPRYVLHFTPTGSSGINQVERWFAKITTQAIRRGSFRSVKHLIEAIEAYILSTITSPDHFVGAPPPTASSRKSPLHAIRHQIRSGRGKDGWKQPKISTGFSTLRDYSRVATKFVLRWCD